MCERPEGFLVTAVCSPDFWKIAAPIAVNFVLTVINFVLASGAYRKRRGEERKYESSVYLYQSIVVDKIGRYLEFAQRATAQFYATQAAVAAQSRPSLVMGIVTKGCDELHRIDQEVDVSLLNPTICISHITFSTVSETWERFYDSVTDATTKLSGPLPPQVLERLNSQVTEANRAFHRELGDGVRSAYPG